MSLPVNDLQFISYDMLYQHTFILQKELIPPSVQSKILKLVKTTEVTSYKKIFIESDCEHQKAVLPGLSNH